MVVFPEQGFPHITISGLMSYGPLAILTWQTNVGKREMKDRAHLLIEGPNSMIARSLRSTLSQSLRWTAVRLSSSTVNPTLFEKIANKSIPSDIIFEDKIVVSYMAEYH